MHRVPNMTEVLSMDLNADHDDYDKDYRDKSN